MDDNSLAHTKLKCQYHALEYAIRNTQGLKRNTALCDRLKVSEQKAE